MTKTHNSVLCCLGRVQHQKVTIFKRVQLHDFLSKWYQIYSGAYQERPHSEFKENTFNHSQDMSNQKFFFSSSSFCPHLTKITVTCKHILRLG